MGVAGLLLAHWLALVHAMQFPVEQMGALAGQVVLILH